MSARTARKEERQSETGVSALTVCIWNFMARLRSDPCRARTECSSFKAVIGWQPSFFTGVGPAVAAAIAGSSSYPRRKNDPGPLIRLRRSFLKPVPLGWWVSTVLLSVGIMIAASLLTQAFSADRAQTIRRVSAHDLLLLSSISLADNPFEEIGWPGRLMLRGRLQ